jgi:hypothetical protein
VRILVAAALALLVFGCDGDSGPEGSVSENCREYAEKQARRADPDAPLIPGVITVGFIEDVGRPGPGDRLEALGTTYVIPLPYQQAGVVCVKPGHEERWIEILKSQDWIEWAHTERPLPAFSEGE